MSGIGFFFAGLMLFSVFKWLRGKLADGAIAEQKWLLRAWILAAPLGYIAVETGWIVRCVGRQPWTVYGQIRTVDAVSRIPASNVLTSLIFFTTVYSLLFFSALYYGSRIIRKGPNFDLELPNQKLVLAPAELVPDQRPVEAQQ